MDGIHGRILNVSLLAGSRSHRAYNARAGVSAPDLTDRQLAAGLPPKPSLNLQNFGGKTIADLVFVNHYLGGSGAWDPADIASIDAALARAMSDAGLQSVIGQYYDATITSRMMPSAVLPEPAPARIYKNQVEALAAQIYAGGSLAGADPASTLVNIMLPRGTVLVDGFSPGFTPPAGEEAEHERRQQAVVKIDDDADADSLNGLGGYHGSTHITSAGTDTALYYAVGVYSEGNNGIPVFDEPWKNVVATFYHELNEARTDPDVEDVIRTNDTSMLGWYSGNGGEIGDIPITDAGSNLSLVFREIDLADGSGTVPVQLMWSNKDDGPAASIA